MSNACGAAPNDPSHEDVLRTLRRMLFKMADKLDDAHCGARPDTETHMALAQWFARCTLPGQLGAWAMKGPSAGLSMISGLLSNADPQTACKHVYGLAALSWQARSLNAALSPYADDLECRTFVGTFDRLADMLKADPGASGATGPGGNEVGDAYRRWQLREEVNDAAAVTAHNRLIIENGDAECEAAIAALEQGWCGDR